jgi:CARDB
MKHLVSVAGSQNSRAELLFIDLDPKGGGVFHCNQTAEGPNSAWSSWATLANVSPGLSSPASALDGNGTLALAWLNDGVIWVAPAKGPNDGLGAARALDTQDLTSLKIAKNLDGRLEFLALDNAGRLWSIAQAAVGNWTEMNIHFLDGTDLQQIAVSPYLDGRLTVVAAGGDGMVYRIEQLGPGLNWGKWINLGGIQIQGVSACANADGRLDIVAIGGDGNLWDYYQLLDGTWSNWKFIEAGKFVGAPILVRNKDGRLEVIAQSSDSSLYHAYQSKPGQGWIKATQLIADVDPPIADFYVAEMNDGRLALAAAYDQSCSCFFVSQATPSALTFSPSNQQPGVACIASVKITKFTANPDYINLGQSASLEYAIDAEFCNPISIGITAQATGFPPMPLYLPPGFNPVSGSLQVSPTKQTIYTMTAICLQNGASDKKTTTVTIAPAQTAEAKLIVVGPYLAPEYPEANEEITATIYVQNVGNASTTAFDVDFLLDEVQSSSVAQAALTSGTTATITTTIDGLQEGFHDLEWTIPQYPGAQIAVTISI